MHGIDLAVLGKVYLKRGDRNTLLCQGEEIRALPRVLRLAGRTHPVHGFAMGIACLDHRLGAAAGRAGIRDPREARRTSDGQTTVVSTSMAPRVAFE